MRNAYYKLDIKIFTEIKNVLLKKYNSMIYIIHYYYIKKKMDDNFKTLK
jgi:hypothetical protein